MSFINYVTKVAVEGISEYFLSAILVMSLRLASL